MTGRPALRDTPTFSDWQSRADALGLRPRGRELVGPCPSCGGTDRFAVKRLDNGAALVNCRQCQDFGEILRAAGLADEPPERRDRQPDMTHEYRRADGTRYHRVYRCGSGPDKDVWQDAGFDGTRDPYRIEEAPDWGDRPLVIVESEKDADRLATLGYASLSWLGGADQVLRTRWAAVAGHAVILSPDNDPPGARAMTTLAATLQALGCDVRAVAVPDGAPARWNAADATETEIAALIDGASAVSVPPSPIGGEIRDGDGEGAAFVPTMGEFYAMDLSPPEFLVEGLIPKSGVAMLAAKPDVGKSTTVRTLSLAVSRGDSFLGRSVQRGKVFYGGFEEIPAMVRAHFQKMGATAEDTIFPFVQPVPDGFVDTLAAWIARERPALVILDTLGKLDPKADESAYHEMNSLLLPYVAMARTYGCAVLVCHHSKKTETGNFADDVLGSTAIRGNVDTTLGIRLVGQKRVIQSVQRYGEPMPETVIVLDEATGRIEAAGTLADERAERLESDILDTLAAEGGPMNKTDVAGKVEGRRQDVARALDRLAKSGRLHTWKQGNAVMYSLEEKPVRPSPPL